MNSQLPLFIELQKYDRRLVDILDKKKTALAIIKTAQSPVLEVSTQLKTVQKAGASIHDNPTRWAMWARVGNEQQD